MKVKAAVEPGDMEPLGAEGLEHLLHVGVSSTVGDTFETRVACLTDVIARALRVDWSYARTFRLLNDWGSAARPDGWSGGLGPCYRDHRSTETWDEPPDAVPRAVSRTFGTALPTRAHGEEWDGSPRVQRSGRMVGLVARCTAEAGFLLVLGRRSGRAFSATKARALALVGADLVRAVSAVILSQQGTQGLASTSTLGTLTLGPNGEVLRADVAAQALIASIDRGDYGLPADPLLKALLTLGRPGSCRLERVSLPVVGGETMSVSLLPFDPERGTAVAVLRVQPHACLVPSLLLEDAHELTPRERQVATLAAQGLRQAEIAKRLGISLATVKVHLSHCYDKLDVHSQPTLVARVRWAGPLPCPDC